MLTFYCLSAIVIWLGILSLRSGFRFSDYIRKEMARPLADFTPYASVIAPCRGLDQGLRANLTALFRQNYPSYEIIFVSDRADDPALKIVADVCATTGRETGVTARVVIAGQAADSGQKVHNLRVALSQVDPRCSLLVFVDTDVRPHAAWLRTLVAPLADETMGAATGYRWFIPLTGGLASHLRSVWNASIASALGEDEEKNFCWGGSTAIRRATFESLSVSERWRGTVSDDFTLLRVLRETKLPIHFVPQCLIASVADCSLSELLEFTTRQLKIARIYATHFWQSVLLGSLLFVLVFFGGLVLVAARAATGRPVALPLILLLIIFGLGAAKAYVRLRAVGEPLRDYRAELRRSALAHLFLWPLSSALYLYNATAAVISHRINWRGITYELKSPTEAVIISRDS